MASVHPLFSHSTIAAPTLRPFWARIATTAGVERITIMAYTTADAIVKAVELYFDGEEPMPTDEVSVSAGPAKLPMAA